MKYDLKALPVHEIPEEGLELKGELESDFLELKKDPVYQSDGKVSYELRLENHLELVLMIGKVVVPLKLTCGRCGEYFPYLIHLDPYLAEIDAKSENVLDLIEVLREDILLSLPGFPRCESSNVEDRECPALGKFETSENTEVDKTKDQGFHAGRDIWKSLDELKIQPKSDTLE